MDGLPVAGLDPTQECQSIAHLELVRVRMLSHHVDPHHIEAGTVIADGTAAAPTEQIEQTGTIHHSLRSGMISASTGCVPRVA